MMPRTAMVLATCSLLTAGIVGMLFTLGKLDVRLPFGEQPYTLTVKLDDAAGLQAAHNPLVMVAGAKVGRVTAVEVRDGQASATLTLDPGVEGKVFRDATVEVRPSGVIPVLTVKVEPGTPQAGALASGATIGARRTSAYVAPDKLVSVLDVDTRAYLQVLLSESDTALAGRGDDVARDIAQMAPTTASAGRVMRAVADRRELVSRLVRNIRVLSATLARRRTELGDVVDQGNRVLKVTATRSPELDETMRRLPRTVRSAEAAVRELRTLSGPLSAGLDGVNPALEDLPAGLRSLRSNTPELRRLVRELAALQDVAKTQLPPLHRFTQKLGASSASAIPDVRSAAKAVQVLAENTEGVKQSADLLSAISSTGDVNGILGRVQLTSLEPPTAENFGLLPAGRTARARSRTKQELSTQLATALEERCATDTTACLLRVLVPGLPGNDGSARTP